MKTLDSAIREAFAASFDSRDVQIDKYPDGLYVLLYLGGKMRELHIRSLAGRTYFAVVLGSFTEDEREFLVGASPQGLAYRIGEENGELQLYICQVITADTIGSLLKPVLDLLEEGVTNFEGEVGSMLADMQNYVRLDADGEELEGEKRTIH